MAVGASRAIVAAVARRRRAVRADAAAVVVARAEPRRRRRVGGAAQCFEQLAPLGGVLAAELDRVGGEGGGRASGRARVAYM